MKKNLIIFILYLIVSCCLTFLIVHASFSQIVPIPLTPIETPNPNETPIPNDTMHHPTRLMTRQDTLRIIGEAVNKGIFYKESYHVQLKITERFYNDYESLYKENRNMYSLLDSLSHLQKSNPWNAVAITAGVVSLLWSAVYLILKQ
ncbi:MAG: hypothetical protein NTV87_16580 [Ignavibacteriae bacterium]|nr:hypothetical protein [Ignavibacteriota bacterium]